MPSSVRNTDPVATKSPDKGPVKPRPRPPSLWNVEDVVNWCERHCGELGVKYSGVFRKNNITGRALLLINSTLVLERMGISDPTHREEIWREIIKLKLKADILELRSFDTTVPPSSSSSSSSSSVQPPSGYK